MSPPHTAYDFSVKMFFILHSINWPNFIVWLPLLLEIFVSMCIAIVYFSACDVIIFEIKLTFLIKPYFYVTTKSRQKPIFLRMNEFLRWNKKHLSSFLKSFSFSYQKLSQTWEYAFKTPYTKMSTWKNLIMFIRHSFTKLY